MTTDPVTPATVRNMTMATSSVVTERGAPPGPVPELKAWTWSTPERRSGIAVTSSAHTAASRSPVTNSTRSHQCEPMSAKARDRPAKAGSTRQLSSSSVDNQS